jgi:hypothetical protein
VGASLEGSREPTEFIFFLASLLGFLAVCGASWAVWRRARDMPSGLDLGR